MKAQQQIFLGTTADDFETRSDADRLTYYVQNLQTKGYNTQNQY